MIKNGGSRLPFLMWQLYRLFASIFCPHSSKPMRQKDFRFYPAAIEPFFLYSTVKIMHQNQSATIVEMKGF